MTVIAREYDITANSACFDNDNEFDSDITANSACFDNDNEFDNDITANSVVCFRD